MSKWRSSIFKFDFDNEEFAPISFHDKVEKQKLKEFEQEMFLKDWPDRHAWIAECAYYKSERRGGAPGLELDDSLVAEKKFMRQSQ